MRVSAGIGSVPNMSISGPSSRSGASTSAAASRVAEHRAVDDDELPAAEELGDLGQRRELHDPRARRDVLGGAGRPRGPALQDALGLRPVPGHHARVGLGDRQQLELELGDDAEVAAAAAQRPEQVGLALGVDLDDLAVGGHELRRR